MLDAFNTSISCVLALVTAWAAMSHRVRCGLIAHVGLALISFGFFGVFLMSVQAYYTDHGALAAAHAFVHVGLVLCATGYFVRARRRGHQRRTSDWIDRRIRR